VLEALGIHLGTLPSAAASLVDLSDLRVSADLAQRAETTDIRLREARTDGLRTQGRWRKVGQKTRAAFLLDLDLTRIGVSLENSSSDIDPFVGSDWLAGELTRLGLTSPRPGSR
jgi:hypothetical protein